MRFLVLALGLALTLAHPLQATVPTPSSKFEPPLQTTKVYGIYLSSLGDTIPDLLSINGAWNFAPDWRLTGGIALGTGLGVGVGIKYLLLTEENAFRPFVGFSISYLRTTLLDSIANLFSLGYKAQNFAYVYPMIPLGFDWSTPSGVNLGFGASLAHQFWTDDPSVTTAFGVQILPFINVGYFF
jgi:hypothetical protein